MKQLIFLPKFGGFYQENFTDRYAKTVEMGDTDSIDFSKTYNNVAKLMVDDQFKGYELRLKEEFPEIVKSVKFSHLQSPRFYNFESDVIYAIINISIDRLKRFIDNTELEVFLKENYSSYSGFVSFIKTDANEFWGELNYELNNKSKDTCSTYLSILFEFLCRDWEIVWGEDFDTFESIVLK